MGRLLDEDDVIAEIEHHKQFVMEKQKQKYGDTDGMTDLYFLAHDHIKEAIKAKVPSEQLDIIRCKDCDWWTKQEDSLQGRCDRYGHYPTGAWFCASAKRREE